MIGCYTSRPQHPAPSADLRTPPLALIAVEFVAAAFRRAGWETSILIADPRLEMRVSIRKINDLKISNRLNTGGASLAR